MEVADNLDTRISRFEELLIGRAESVTKELEARSQSAADLLTTRTEHLSGTIRTSAGEAARSLEQLATASAEVIGTRVEQLTNAIKTNTSDAERTLTNLTASTTGTIGSRIEQLNEAVKINSSEAERSRAYDRILNRIELSSVPSELDRGTTQAHQLIVDEAPFLFVMHDRNPVMYSPKVKGFVQAQSWFQDYTKVCMEK